MKYKVLFDIQYFNGSSRFEESKFETKGKGKKVLKAHLKEYVKNTLIYEAESKPVNIRIVRIDNTFIKGKSSFHFFIKFSTF